MSLTQQGIHFRHYLSSSRQKILKYPFLKLACTQLINHPESGHQIQYGDLLKNIMGNQDLLMAEQPLPQIVTLFNEAILPKLLTQFKQIKATVTDK